MKKLISYLVIWTGALGPMMKIEKEITMEILVLEVVHQLAELSLPLKVLQFLFVLHNLNYISFCPLITQTILRPLRPRFIRLYYKID